MPRPTGQGPGIRFGSIAARCAGSIAHPNESIRMRKWPPLAGGGCGSGPRLARADAEVAPPHSGCPAPPGGVKSASECVDSDAEVAPTGRGDAEVDPPPGADGGRMRKWPRLRGRLPGRMRKWPGLTAAAPHRQAGSKVPRNVSIRMRKWPRLGQRMRNWPRLQGRMRKWPRLRGRMRGRMRKWPRPTERQKLCKEFLTRGMPRAYCRVKNLLHGRASWSTRSATSGRVSSSA